MIHLLKVDHGGNDVWKQFDLDPPPAPLPAMDIKYLLYQHAEDEKYQEMAEGDFPRTRYSNNGNDNYAANSDDHLDTDSNSDSASASEEHSNLNTNPEKSIFFAQLAKKRRRRHGPQSRSAQRKRKVPKIRTVRRVLSRNSLQIILKDDNLLEQAVRNQYPLADNREQVGDRHREHDSLVHRILETPEEIVVLSMMQQDWERALEAMQV